MELLRDTNRDDNPPPSDEGDNGNESPDDSDSLGSSDISEFEDTLEGFDDEETEVQAVFVNVVHRIDDLIALSKRVRHPTHRTGFSRGDDFSRRDEESPHRDLYECLALPDRDHIEEVLRSFGQDREAVGPKSFLADRLTAANTRRRRQFGYWCQHKFNLARRTGSVRERHRRQQEIPLPTTLHAPPSLSELSKPTTATHFDRIRAKPEDDDEISNVSAMSYGASLAADPAGDADAFPEPPRRYAEQEGLKEFECPYCFIICDRKTLEKRRWR